MSEQVLVKQGEHNRFVPRNAPFAVCCEGVLEFEERDVDELSGWDLGSIKDMVLTVKFETRVLND